MPDGGGYGGAENAQKTRPVNLATGRLCFLKASGAPSGKRGGKMEAVEANAASFYLKWLTTP